MVLGQQGIHRPKNELTPKINSKCVSDLCVKYNILNHETIRGKRRGESLRPWTWQWV